MKVLIIGDTGDVGSAVIEACLNQQHVVTAFVRKISHISIDLLEHPRLRVIKGNTTSHVALVNAFRDQDAIIQANIGGSASAPGSSDSEQFIRCIFIAVKEVQADRKRHDPPLRLWMVSGDTFSEIPGGFGRINPDVTPIHPKYYKDYAFLQQDARDVDWSLKCPGIIAHGQVRVLLYECKPGSS